MSRSEDLLISAIVRGAGVRTAIRLGVSSDLFMRRKAEWLYLEGHKGVSKQSFKARFPGFPVIKVDPEEIELLVAQCQRNRAEYDLGQMFERMQKRLGRDEPTELAGKLEAETRAIIARYTQGQSVDIIHEWQTLYEQVKQTAAATANGQQPGWPFGVPTLDDNLSGMMSPDLVVILARMGEFKTWLSLYFAVSANLAGAKVLYASLEMSPHQIGLRVHTLMGRLLAMSFKEKYKQQFTNMGLMMGAVDLKEYRHFLRQASKQVKKGFIVPPSKGRFDMTRMAAEVERHQPDIAFFDYFGLGVGSDEKGENWVRAANASHAAKHAIAMEYNIPFVMNAQAGRGAADSKDVPDKHHVGLTDALAADADQMISLRMHSGRLKCRVIKNRRGKDNIAFELGTDVDRGIIEEVETAKAKHADDEED